MKVLHVFTLAVTAEAFFDGQFKYLVQNGHQITLVCSGDSNDIKDFAKRNSIEYIPIEIPRTIQPLNDLQALLKIIRLVRKEKFEVVVGHTPKGALLSMLASYFTGSKNRIYLRHGLIFTTSTGLKRKILKLEEKFVSSLATKIINVSPSLSSLAVKEKLNKKNKQLVIGRGTCGGIDTGNIFNPDNLDPGMLRMFRVSQKINKDDYVVGFCGRLCKDKGIIELVEGFKLFKKENPKVKVKLLLVGGYDSRDVLPVQIREQINDDKDIIQVGHINSNIQYQYALMDVLVFPSHREGFGMCSIEAQAMGVPVLTSRSHGCIDTIIEGITGEYIDLSARGVAEGIQSMLDSQKRKLMGEQGRINVIKHYDHKVLWSKILDFYNNFNS